MWSQRIQDTVNFHISPSDTRVLVYVYLCVCILDAHVNKREYMHITIRF